jgi:Tol biopolymer transport system component
VVVFVDVAHNLLAWNPSSLTYIPIATTGDVQQAWVSPDGALVVFTRTTDYQSYNLDIIRSDGSNHHTLFSHDQFLALPHPEGTLGTAPAQLAWIPNSHRIAMSLRAVLNGPGSVIGNDLMVIDAEDGSVSTLLSEKESWQFAFSPDGSKIAVSLPDGMDLFDANGKALAPSKFFGYPLVNTASDYEYTPRVTWKDDSTAFAFTIPPIAPFSDDPNGKTRAIVGDAANATFTTPVTVPMKYLVPQAFSPDLSYIAYTQRADAATNVVACILPLWTAVSMKCILPIIR